MASLSFNRTINLTTHAGNPAPKYVGSLKIAQETNGDVYQYYIVDNLTNDKKGALSDSSVSFDAPTKHLTSERVANIGVKSFPQLGAVGLYTRLDTLASYMLLPIHTKIDKSTAPTLVVSQSGTNVTFTITPPADTSYMCYRVVMALGAASYEYVTYDTTLTVTAPYASGTYEIYCVGYINEGERVSVDSTHQSVVITGSGVPDAPASDVYVTAAQFDANNILRLTMSTGQVVVASNAPISGSTNTLLNVTLDADDWVGSVAPYSQTVSVQGVALTGCAYVASPASSCWGSYCHCGIYMDEPTVQDSITFYATTDKPSVDLSVQVLKMGVQT